MSILIRPMRESDLDEADAVFRLAFGTFLGMPEPTGFAAGCDYIHQRFHGSPESALVAENDGRLIGANMVANWGSFGTFGPLFVRPEYWNKGVAQMLLGPTMEIFEQWKVRDAGLFTFPNSPRHITLYQKFGFWPRFLIAVVAKPVVPCDAPFTTTGDCRSVTDAIYEGLDAAVEIRSVKKQDLGATILTDDAFAVCHCGEGTEAGPGNLYIKFAAVKPGPNISSRFAGLLKACESYAASRGLTQIETGVHMERTNCYRDLLQLGYRLERPALAMHRDNRPAYNRPETYVLDDWR